MDKVQFRPAHLAAHLAARADVDTNAAASQVAQRDLGRYYDLMALTLASVELSQGEASLIVDALNGTLIDLTAAQMLAAEIADGLDDGLAEKWGVNGPALVAKVGSWSLAQRLAVCDAAERFWRGAHHVEVVGERLAVVGLVRRP